MAPQKSRLDQNELNPCLQEHNISLRCLDRNGYDKEKCHLEFENYKACMKFWERVKRDRAQRGISPRLPPVEERAELKREYMKKFRP